MSRRPIAIACQGGGSQCAFVAGALKTLFAERIQDRFDIVGLSGTSGGALTAGVAWYGMLTQARGDRTLVEDRIVGLWRDLTAQSPQEIAFDTLCIASLRMAERGYVPTYASSPSSLPFRLWQKAAAAAIGRPEFTDLRALLLKHLDFGALTSLVGAESPVLLAGACDVLEGTFKIFSSANSEIQVESLLASAAIPTLFPATMANGHAYWDGIFSSNPPVVGFFRRPYMGRQITIPQEVWIIQVNPSRYETVPEVPSEILDRRNHIAGNLSLRHELQLIAVMNLLLQEKALSEEFRARFGLESHEAITVRFIRMSEDLQRSLDYPSKLSRRPAHIARLMADGEAQARAFLTQLGQEERAPAFVPAEAQLH